MARARRLPARLAALLVAAAAALAHAEDEIDDATLVAGLRDAAQAYEHARGVVRDGARAAALYCQAARLGDAASQYDLGWMYAYGRGVARDDAAAAWFFRAAADQGVAQAARMLPQVGAPAAEAPACMRPPPLAFVAAPEPEAPVAPPAPTPIAAPRSIADLVHRIAAQYRVPAPLVLAIMQAESNFDPRAVSPKNAQGLMQLIPDTQARFRVRDAFDPAQNVRGGIAYLRWLLAYFEGNVALVAAAYNAGEGTVERYRGVPPFAETRAYVRRILARVTPAVQPFDAGITPPSPQLAALRAH